MEAVAADAVVLIILIGERIHVGLAGHGLMEGSIEHGDHGNIAHHGLAGIDAGDVGRVMQRGKRRALFQSRHNGIVDFDRAGKLLTTVNDAVTDGVDLAHGSDNTVLSAGELVDDGGDRFGMGRKREILIEDGLAADQRGVLQMTVDADALAEALRHDLLGLHVDQLILQRRTACVDDQNFHVMCSFLFFITRGNTYHGYHGTVI